MAKSQLKDSRISFGKAFNTWRRMNHLSQEEIQQASSDIGYKVSNSQISNAENGILEPRPKFFVHLGAFNQFLDTAEHTRIRDLELRKKLKNCNYFPSPINEKMPANASELFNYFIGGVPLPIGLEPIDLHDFDHKGKDDLIDRLKNLTLAEKLVIKKLLQE
jgi:transcriptional regulator with XRE-family HTH domain